MKNWNKHNFIYKEKKEQRNYIALFYDKCEINCYKNSTDTAKKGLK